MKGKLVGIILLVALTASVLTGCDDKPMTIEEAEDFYQQNETDIQTVIHYLQALDYESVGIYIGEGIYEGDDQLILNNSYTIQKKPLKDEPVFEAASRLHENGCHQIEYDTETNSVDFLLWRSGEVGCGIALSLDGVRPPAVIYMTSCVSMKETGWYYYVSDFNKWRQQQSDSSIDP